MSGGVSGWMPDVLPGYWQRTLALGPDPAGEGDIVATLVRRGSEAEASEGSVADRAVLAVHGYTDYFFHTELADHFAGRGFAFYALDLQKCGRSHRDGAGPTRPQGPRAHHGHCRQQHGPGRRSRARAS